MAATEQNGIDILCDAAGSDMLLSSLFSLAAPVSVADSNQRAQPPLQQEQHELQHSLPPASPSKHQIFQQQLDPALQQHQGETPQRIASTLPTKRKLSDASASSPSHVCHICRRVYERADHLTRHLRSHENARPYQCTRCPKRFNRADLLTRHETTHDRDGAAKDRPFIRRSDRAAEACLNCAASKAKCEDQKPCSRCRSKSLTCQMPVRRGNQYRTSESQAGMSPSDSSVVASTTGNDSQVFTAGEATYALPQSAIAHQGHTVDAAVDYSVTSFLGAPILEKSPAESLLFAATQSIFPEIEFSWDADFGSYKIPSSDVAGRNPQSGNAGKRASRQGRKGIVSVEAPLQRSVWLYEPEANGQAGCPVSRSDIVSPYLRDSMFAMVLANNPIPHRVPTFPSAELLGYVIETYFRSEDPKSEAFIHRSSFDPSATSQELFSAVVSSGASCISTPAIWQFGLALDEITASVIGKRVSMDPGVAMLESSCLAVRDITLLQASVLHLETGQWSGFNRQTEMAESFAPQILILLRKAGKLSFTSDLTTHTPNTGDSSETLESKWQTFMAIESYKRLAIRAFLHDAQTSIVSWKGPTLAYSQLDFALPAARDLWKASNSQIWWDLNLAKGSFPPTGFPRLSDVRDCQFVMTEQNTWVDTESCCKAALHGLWGQIWTYRNAIAQCHHAAPDRPGSDVPEWARSLYQELYEGLGKLSTQLKSTQTPRPELSLLSDFFMMIIHVSLDDVQRLAGRKGDEGSRRAMQLLESTWLPGPESRYAAWHAGQVLRHAQECMPTTLRGFNAMVVYFASLTLWAYGLLSQRTTNGDQVMGQEVLSLNEPETRETTMFLELGQGTPSLSSPEGLRLQLEPVSNYVAVLSLARLIFRQNYPVASEAMPPLVESLCRHLGDLQGGLEGYLVTKTL
ncbi:transcription factor Pig1p [Fusarium pseudocircinatum]|uniref:Transcription factor Pig1p n=1 Tax=Fusarium pseudocircinatum TaxID=56676 RepID=A0A8H5NSE1_9HYPO|nr:transcription factor Pig1p [Fusarium pseudocircinatum]